MLENLEENNSNPRDNNSFSREELKKRLEGFRESIQDLRKRNSELSSEIDKLKNNSTQRKRYIIVKRQQYIQRVGDSDGRGSREPDKGNS